VSYGPVAGLWGSTVQFELYSDVALPSLGCQWAFSLSSCPVGSYCPDGASDPLPCPGGRFGAEEGLYTSSCSGPCTAGFFCPPGSTNATVTEW
jgi:hypothetical protein